MSIIEFPLRQPVAIFLIVLVIILLVPLLLRRLKIPHIVGLIVAGMIIGPYGFNILERDASFQIFGQVGILYLMFLAGVEIDMLNLKQNSRKGDKTKEAYIFAMNGQLIKIITLSQGDNIVDISSLQSAIYLLRCEDKTIKFRK